MGLDQLLELTSSVSMKLLPILGAIILVFLIVFVHHLIKVLTQTNTTLVAMSKTIEITNNELKQLEKPLATLNELSETVDCVHEASKNAVRSAFITIIENFSSIKEWFMKFDKTSETPSTTNNNSENENGGEGNGE
ncbi:MAG: histidine kinase [Erysipelotrichaceae bacterium]